jgi:hypothetical protein
MELEFLCDVQWRYTLLDEVAPSAAGDGSIYGEGEAEFEGRLAGHARWSNAPRLHGGFAHPDGRGSIDVGDGAFELFRLTGKSDLADGSGIHVMTFSTDHPPLRWLNDVIAVGEGSIDVAASALAMRYYTCRVDYRPAVDPAMTDSSS